MQDWYVEKREAIEKVFAQAEPVVDEAEIFTSPTGRYSLEVIPHRTGPKSWRYSKGIVRLEETGELISEIKRNYSAFPYSWAEHHPTGHDYVVAGEDYQGQTIVELDTGRRIDHVPDAAHQGFGFCWAAHYPSPDGRFIFVDGCIWAGPYELVQYDFHQPMSLPYSEINRWPVEKVHGFEPDGSLVWEYLAEIRTTDGKRVDEMSEEEEEEFESDENYSELLGEVTIRMKWHPDGHAEVIGDEN